jgi:hypothetical protein
MPCCGALADGRLDCCWLRLAAPDELEDGAPEPPDDEPEPPPEPELPDPLEPPDEPELTGVPELCELAAGAGVTTAGMTGGGFAAGLCRAGRW